MRFSITESLRYLSHRETLEMFQRALTRADIAVAYTNGFNPRIRLSLPLPRSVAVAAEDELLCVGIEETQPANAGRIEEEMSSQLPRGLKVLSVE
ncbi:MAG: TIGR03936 family radical SAM-associated protein, partial [Planctomycetes bacterium]|nr:TIGR03936 family radical SAM-associated protein [Planctomycetota bacterium]